MRRVCVLIWIVLASCGSMLAQDEADAARPRKRAADLPKAATSSDGFVEVIASDVPGDPVGFRLPVLQFSTRLLREIERVYGLEMPRGEVGLLVHAQNGTTNDVRVISRVGRREAHVITHVWLPSPGFSDLGALRYAVAKAYFRAWVDRSRPRGKAGVARVAAEVPDWLVLGALRALTGEGVHDDKRAVLAMWSEARLPFFPVLCRDLRAGGGEQAALCGYIVSWLRERKLFKAVLEGLASGEKLTGAKLAFDLTGEKDPDLQDRASDERLARLTRAVLSPGKASSWDLKVFTSRLLLYPAEFDKNIGANRTSYTFREAIARAAEDPALRAAAARKAREMPFSALGRGPVLAEVSEAYRLFLAGLARGDAPEELTRLLDDAETQLQEILNEDRKDDNR